MLNCNAFCSRRNEAKIKNNLRYDGMERGCDERNVKWRGMEKNREDFEVLSQDI